MRVNPNLALPTKKSLVPIVGKNEKQASPYLWRKQHGDDDENYHEDDENDDDDNEADDGDEENDDNDLLAASLSFVFITLIITIGPAAFLSSTLKRCPSWPKTDKYHAF